MKYQQLQGELKDFAVFSLVDIRKIDPTFYRHQLNEWQNKGYIKKLRRGYYMFADLPLSEEVLFLIANRLYPPSYVSFEMALSYYGLIPEGVYSITSASSKKTASFKSPVTEFSYQQIKAEYFFGYRLETKNGYTYKIAEIEKAVLDYVYLHPNIIKPEDFYEWRFNSEEFLEKADIKKFRKYAMVYTSRGFLRRTEDLISLIKQSK